VKFEEETETYEGFQAMGALAMAMMESVGIREYIDSMCAHDAARRILSPGMAVKAMLGPIFGFKHKSPLANIRMFYSSAPTDLMFGPKVEKSCLNDSAFGRSLDTLFEADREEMIWKCAEICAKKFDLPSDVFYTDATNISLYAVPQEGKEGVAVPAYSGHAKDGRNGLVQYSMVSVTDSNGLLRCQKPCSGNASDTIMDRDMVNFLSERLDRSVSTIVADSKLANAATIDLLYEKDMGFVTKCPSSFAGKVRDRVLKASEGKMRACKERKGAMVCDIFEKAGDRSLRFVAYTLGTNEKESVRFYLENGEKKLKAVFGKLKNAEFNCEPDAENALRKAIAECDLTAYEIFAETVPYDVRPKRPGRGRPRKGTEAPATVTKYRIEASWEFDEDLAKRMSNDRGTQVLITNLPCSDGAKSNLRDGADAETVMMTYLDEYKIEHTYRLMKSGLGIDSVYLHTPERENAMMFVIGIATIISNTVDALLKRMPGKRMTMDHLCWKMMSVSVDYDRESDTMRIRGYKGASKELFGYVNALNISPGLLLGRNGK
jgi:transposase